jgi:hypothetical protein
MKELTLQEKALAVIEALVSDDLTQDLEFDCALHPEKSPMLTDADIKTINNKLTAIYMVAHGVNPHSCYHVHETWRKDIEKRYRQFLKKGAISKPISQEAKK